MKRIRRKKTKEKVNISRFIIPIILSLIVIGISIDYNLTINKDLNPNYLFSKYSFNIFKYLLQKQPIFRAPLNNPPVFDPASLPNVNQLLEDTNYYFDLNATDIDNETLVFSDDTSLFDVNPSSGVINFTPNHLQIGLYNGDNAVALLVKDPSEQGDVFFWGFTIISVNDQPILSNIGNRQVRANVRFNYIVNATDEEDDHLGIKNGNLTFSDDTNLFDINPVTGEIDFIPNETQAGQYQINISVVDSQGGIDAEIVILDILPNSAPIFTAFPNSTAFEDILYNSFATANDPDNDQVMYSDNSSLFDISINSGTISFLPLMIDVGNYTFALFANDSFGAITTEILTLEILGTNDAPVFNPIIGNLLADEDSLFIYDINATDEEDAPLFENGNLTYYTNSSWFNISINGYFNFTPINENVGTNWIEFRVNDSRNSQTVEIVNLTVLNTNDVPNITSFYPTNLSFSVYENNSIYFNHSKDDPDLLHGIGFDTLSNRWIVNSFINQSIEFRMFNFSYTPNFLVSNRSFNNTVNVTLWVFDVSLASQSLSWYLNVINVNRLPEFYALIPNQTWGRGSQNTNIDLDNYFNDSDNDPLFFEYAFLVNGSFVNNSNNIEVIINNNTDVVTLIPNSQFVGIEYIKFNVSDLINKSSSNIIALNVTDQELIVVQVPTPTGGGGGGGGGSRRQVASLSVHIEPLIAAKSNATLETNVSFTNTGDVVLNNIVLSLFTT